MNNFPCNYFASTSFVEWISVFAPILALFILWGLFWKGLALWHAGRRGQPGWFVVLLVVNTAGILEIIYLFGVLKIKFKELFHR